MIANVEEFKSRAKESFDAWITAPSKERRNAFLDTTGEYFRALALDGNQSAGLIWIAELFMEFHERHNSQASVLSAIEMANLNKDID